MKSYNYLKHSDYALPLILFSSLLIYGVHVAHYLFVLPAPSDPLQYLGSCIWGSTYGYFAYIDRINILSGLRIFTKFISPAYFAGTIYIMFIQLLTLLIGVLWCNKLAGKWAALTFATLINTSYMTLSIATYVYPVQTAALFSLLALFCFYYREIKNRYFNFLIWSGIFTGLACFSKVTAVAGALFLCSYLLIIKKDFSGCLKFSIGCILGAIISFLIFVLLFNYQSLFNIFHLYFKQFNNQLVPSSYTSNIVQYLHVLLSFKYFPVFIALFIFVGAYKKEPSRFILSYAWAFIGMILAIYAFIKGRGGYTIPYYLYTGYIIAALGISVYLAQNIVQQKEWVGQKKILFFILLLFGFIVLGFQIGIHYPVIKNYEDSYNYYRALDIYTVNSPTTIVYQYLIKLFYALGPIAIIGLLAIIEGARSRKAILLLLVVVAIFSSAYNGSIAYKKAIANQDEATFFYKAAPLLNYVNAKKFVVYIAKWNERPHVEGVLWVYSIFFDRKYPREKTYDAQQLDREKVEKNTTIISNPLQLSSLTGSQIILTDDLHEIVGLFKVQKIIQTIVWSGNSLYVVKAERR